MAFYTSNVYVYRSNQQIYYGEVEFSSSPKEFEVTEVYIRALNGRFKVIVCNKAEWILIVEDL
jgi:hypothetical protein